MSYLDKNARSAKEQDECFNTEQGPYNHGRLWCQVATVIGLNKPIDYKNVGEKFLMIANKYGKAFSSKQASDPYFGVIISGINCSFDYDDGNTQHYINAISRPFENNNTYPVIAISCADHAQSAYYPFTE